MKTIVFKRISLLFGITTLSVVASGMSAQAQTPTNGVKTSASALMPEQSTVAQVDNTTPTQTAPGTFETVPAPTTPTQTAPGTYDQFPTTPTQTAPGTYDQVPTTPTQTAPGIYDPTPAPVVPGQTAPGTPPGTVTPETTPDTTAPVIEDQGLAPGRATRSGPSYIGVGGNIGFGGDTTLSEGAFSVISKIGLTNNFSVRPSALIGDNAAFLIPVTFDFPTTTVGNVGFTPAPYIGGGVAISTGRDDTVGALISAGVDVPLSPEFTATAGVNLGFIDGTDVGLLVGVGYNF